MTDTIDSAHSDRRTGAGEMPRTLADLAVEVLRDRLVVLDIPPGAPLNDEAIGRELGVGRTPVREAIKQLESEHLVVIYPRRGTFAAPIDLADLGPVTEIRAQLEPLAAHRAAVGASAAVRQEMRAYADLLERLSDEQRRGDELMRHDLRVHRMVYSANGNRHLEEVLVQYDNLSTRIWCSVLDRLPDVGAHVVEHVDLLRAIAAGDAADAADRAREHVLAFERGVRAVI